MLQTQSSARNTFAVNPWKIHANMMVSTIHATVNLCFIDKEWEAKESP